MDNDIYRQTRKPITAQEVNPDINPEDVFKSSAELKGSEAKKAEPKKVETKDIPIQSNDMLQIKGNIPPALQVALKARKEVGENSLEEKIVKKQEEIPWEAVNPVSPRLLSNNPKLNELLAGIKETVSQYEEIQLPSKAKFYDDNNCPENGIIHVRPMTGDEEAILSTPRFIKKGQAMDMIFRNCIQEAVKPEKWLVVDRNYLLIYLRGISYGSQYEVEVKCPQCGNRFPTEINLDSLFVNYCPDTFGPSDLSGVLPVTKYKFSYRLQTSDDDKLITEHRDRRARIQGDTALDDTSSYRLALLVNDIEGLTDKQALFTLINRLPIGDITHLRNLVNEPPFGVDTKWGLSCPSCAENFEVEMPYEANFFFPRPRKAARNPA